MEPRKEYGEPDSGKQYDQQYSLLYNLPHELNRAYCDDYLSEYIVYESFYISAITSFLSKKHIISPENCFRFPA